MKKEQWVVAGCLAASVQMFVVFPMWIAILYQILTRIDIPSWTWGLFWAYVPIGFILQGIMQFTAKAIVGAKDDD